MGELAVTGVLRPSGSLGVESLYLHGVVLRMPCPKCGTLWERDLGECPLPSPRVGAPTNAYGYCGPCDYEWPVLVTLGITLTATPEAPTSYDDYKDEPRWPSDS